MLMLAMTSQTDFDQGEALVEEVSSVAAQLS